MKKEILTIILVFTLLVSLIFVSGCVQKQNTTEKEERDLIEIYYSSGYPGFGYYDYYILKNSGKYIWVDTNEYWMGELGNPKIRKLGDLNYEELSALYEKIKEKGFFEMQDEYMPDEAMAGGTIASIEVIETSGGSEEEEFKKTSKKVIVHKRYEPKEFAEIEEMILEFYPPKDCEKSEDCPDPYYERYYDKCTCI